MKIDWKSVSVISVVFFVISTWVSNLLENVINPWNQQLINTAKTPLREVLASISSFFVMKIPIYSVILSVILTLLSIWLASRFLLYFKVRKNKLQIIKATYGLSNKKINITNELNRSVENNELLTILSNHIAGDPCPGVVKRGNIKYKYAGQILEKTFLEGDRIALP
jgi:hypothetical protein